MNKTIFTFWEPKDTIPEYLKLCMNTWKKFLPEYKIVILNYENIENYLDKNYFDYVLYTDFSLPKQADAIRAAILKKYGGIWLDIDTIITSDKIRNILNIESEFVTIGSHIAFIKAEPYALIASKWDDKIKIRLQLFKKFKYSNNLYKKIFQIFHPKLYKKFYNWDYLGNSILKQLFKTKNKHEYYSINKIEINAFPEINKKTMDSADENYKNFYFNNDFSTEVLNSERGIILLHNSWTPKEVLNMPKDKFFEMNCTLSNILKSLNS